MFLPSSCCCCWGVESLLLPPPNRGPLSLPLPVLEGLEPEDPDPESLLEGGDDDDPESLLEGGDDVDPPESLLEGGDDDDPPESPPEDAGGSAGEGVDPVPAPALGGVSAAGGVPAAGGVSAAGGVPAEGGVSAGGGVSAAGGLPAAGLVSAALLLGGVFSPAAGSGSTGFSFPPELPVPPVPPPSVGFSVGGLGVESPEPDVLGVFASVLSEPGRGVSFSLALFEPASMSEEVDGALFELASMSDEGGGVRSASVVFPFEPNSGEVVLSSFSPASPFEESLGRLFPFGVVTPPASLEVSSSAGTTGEDLLLPFGWGTSLSSLSAGKVGGSFLPAFAVGAVSLTVSPPEGGVSASSAGSTGSPPSSFADFFEEGGLEELLSVIPPVGPPDMGVFLKVALSLAGEVSGVSGLSGEVSSNPSGGGGGGFAVFL